jgi:hypothetical protein
MCVLALLAFGLSLGQQSMRNIYMYYIEVAWMKNPTRAAAEAIAKAKMRPAVCKSLKWDSTSRVTTRERSAPGV